MRANQYVASDLSTDAKCRGGSRAATTSKMKCIIITKHSILDIAAALDPPLVITETQTQMRKNSSDFSKNFMNSFFTEHLRTVASVS